MRGSWGDFRCVDSLRRETGNDTEDLVFTWQGRRFWELDESGWGALIAWLAGPARVVRASGEPLSERSVIITTTSGNQSWTHVGSFSKEDAVTVAGFIDGYLEEADAIEPRPFGDRWFLEIPEGHTPQSLRSLFDTVVAHTDPHPAATVVPLRAALSQIFPL